VCVRACVVLVLVVVVGGSAAGWQGCQRQSKFAVQLISFSLSHP